jgi:hypothetical protein
MAMAAPISRLAAFAPEDGQIPFQLSNEYSKVSKKTDKDRFDRSRPRLDTFVGLITLMSGSKSSRP